jgi:methionyl-tRNA synthetase
MLHALDLAMPKAFLVHGWWLCSGEKMSKSIGNVVNPLDYPKQFGTDAFHSFVIREVTVGHDSDVSPELFLSHYNNDLGNGLVNLVSQTQNMLQRYCKGIIPNLRSSSISRAIGRYFHIYRCN